ncbi:MAG: type III-B CRISPR module RAMP protein Cmr4, partial [Sulfuricella sp.]
MKTKIFHLHALSALHVGTGQAVGAVDLPIMRSRASNLPIVPGSALKGVLRDEFTINPQQKRLFGPETDSNKENAHAGALALGDAHLLILPVRSLAGVVAFVTCPFVLARYAKDLGRAEKTPPAAVNVRPDVALVAQVTDCKTDSQKVVLEDLDLEAICGADPWAQTIAVALHPSDAGWQALFKQHFVVVADDVFSFLADTATEVRARIRIDDTKGTVKDGALWYEENLPAESVLWGLAAFSKARDSSDNDENAICKAFVDGVGTEKTIQIGGKATIGRGL